MKRTRVLLCDDTEDILLLMSMELGFHDDIEVVGAAHNGREAVELAERLQPDVVILDLAMPVMGGLEALPRILEVARTKVIVLSGLDASNVASQALELGAALYLEKGVAPDEIAEIVKEVAARPGVHTPRDAVNEATAAAPGGVVVVAVEPDEEARASIDVELRK